MGAFLEKPKTDKVCKHGEAYGLRYGSSAMQGWRMEMEDADVCNTSFELRNWSFFGVFDGHAGSKCSQFCSQHLLKCILDGLPKGLNEPSVESVKKAMAEGFLQIDEKMAQENPWVTGEDHSGTTSVVVLVSPTHILWANCGDSRSIFCRSGALEFATTDHKPGNDTEKMRIEKAGGTVMMQRVNGTLAVSRALGDFDYKRDTKRKSVEQLVSPEPDVTVIERNPGDEFLVLACDGIYDVMTNDEVLEYVRHRLELTNDLDTICSDLIDTCLHKNSRDNMSVVLVTFPGAPKVSEEAIQKDQELQADAKKEITEALEKMVNSAHDPLDVEENHVFQMLMAELPSKYNVAEKRPFINETLFKLTKDKFGNYDGGDFTGPSDPNVAPAEMQINTEDGAHIMIQNVMSTREEYASYDEQLLDLDSSVEDVSGDKPLPPSQHQSDDGNVEMMEVSSEGEPTSSQQQDSSSSSSTVAST